VTVVETARLVMRPWQADDLDHVARLWADPVGVRHTWRQPPTPERVMAEAERILRCWHEHGFGPWAVIDKHSGIWIGKIGLDVLDDWPEDPKVEVGWVLDRSWWGQGLATEGAVASVRFAFGTLGMKRIISVTVPANTASRRVMEKAGLVYQDIREWRGTDIVWYAIDRDAWLTQRHLSATELQRPRRREATLRQAIVAPADCAAQSLLTRNRRPASAREQSNQSSSRPAICSRLSTGT